MKVSFVGAVLRKIGAGNGRLVPMFPVSSLTRPVAIPANDDEDDLYVSVGTRPTSPIAVEQLHEPGTPLEEGSAVLLAGLTPFLRNFLGCAVGCGLDRSSLGGTHKSPSGSQPCWCEIRDNLRCLLLSSCVPYGRGR